MNTNWNEFHLIRRFLLILLGVGLASGFGEILTRLLYPQEIVNPKIKTNDVVTLQEVQAYDLVAGKPNTNFDWYGQQGNRREYEIHGKTNADGFFDKEYPVRKSADIFRVVLLGDSFVEALQVPMVKSVHNVLEGMLNHKINQKRFEVIGLGRSGNGARGNYNFLERFGIKYHPDVVLMEFLPGNDIRNDSVALQVLARRQLEELRKNSLSYLPPVFATSRLPFLLRNSRLIARIGQSVLNLRFHAQRKELPVRNQIPIDLYVYSAEYDDNWNRAWQTALQNIRKAKALANRNQSDFVLINFGERFKMSPDTMDLFLKSNPAMNEYKWNFDHPQEILREFCKKENIKFLDLEPLFQYELKRTQSPLYFKYDGHWNEAGHEYAANKILQFLLEQRMLPQQNISEN